MAGLNQAQQEAVENIKGNLLVLAGPGTGKTRVIVSKVAKLVESGISPESILAVTFSRKATQEMSDRLSELDASIAQRMSVSTLHGLCSEIVQQHGFRLGFQKKPKMMTEAAAYVYFRKLAPRLPLEALLKTSFAEPIIDDLITFFSDCKDEGLWPEGILRYAEALPEETEDDIKIKSEWRGLGDIYNAYQSFCFENGLMDFGDAILCTLRLLQDFPMVREEIQNRYRAILVDEFQDTNWSQIQLLRLLTPADAHIAVVGDDDQSIYRFRGASYSAFKFFEEFFPEPSIVELSETYRLPRAVLETASTLIAANGEHRFRPDKKLKASKDEKLPVTWLKACNYEDEARALCDRVQKILADGTPAKEIGVLVRAHSHAEYFILEAEKRGLRIQNAANRKFFSEDIVKDILAFLKLCVDATDSVAFLRLLDSPLLQISAEDAYAFCRAKNHKAILIDQLQNLEGFYISKEAKEKLTSFYTLYKQLYLDAADKTPSQILLSLYEGIPLIQVLLKDKPESLKLLGRLHVQLASFEASQGDNNLKTIFSVLESVKDLELNFDSEGDEAAHSDAVSILTVHASKGLEFDYVFIPSLVGRRFPSNFRKNTWLVPDDLREEAAPTKESHTEEERRLLYVAMTRAKKQLILSSIERRGTKPSLFLTEDLKDLHMQPSILEIIEIPATPETDLKAFATKKPFSRIAPSKAAGEKKKRALSLSFTQLEKYETCPLSYQFKYDFQIPVSIPAHMQVGQAIHTALEIFFKEIKKERTPSRDDLIQYFEKAFTELRAENPELTDYHLNQAKDRLGKYYDAQGGNFPYPHAIEEDFVLPLGEHKIRGKIDRIDKANDGFRIVDYKTGKAKSNENPEDVKFAKDSLQFSIYALASKEVLKIDVTEMVFDYIYGNKTLSTTRSKEDLVLVKEKITKIADDILNENFTPTPGHHCEFCEYKRICPAIK